jgi:hypothetical protein
MTASTLHANPVSKLRVMPKKGFSRPIDAPKRSSRTQGIGTCGLFVNHRL